MKTESDCPLFSTFKFATLVVEVTNNGAVPSGIIETKRPDFKSLKDIYKLQQINY